MPKGQPEGYRGSASTGGGAGGMRGGLRMTRSTTRVAPRRRTDKLVNQTIQARYNATPRDQWPRIETPRARVVSSRKAERMASKAEKKRTEARQYADDMRVWGSSRKAVNPRLPANMAKTAMKGAAVGAAAAVVVKKTSGGKSPGRVRAMEAKRYEENKSSVGAYIPKKKNSSMKPPALQVPRRRGGVVVGAPRGQAKPNSRLIRRK